jgi:hypothetical protein
LPAYPNLVTQNLLDWIAGLTLILITCAIRIFTIKMNFSSFRSKTSNMMHEISR